MEANGGSNPVKTENAMDDESAMDEESSSQSDIAENDPNLVGEELKKLENDLRDLETQKALSASDRQDALSKLQNVEAKDQELEAKMATARSGLLQKQKDSIYAERRRSAQLKEANALLAKHISEQDQVRVALKDDVASAQEQVRILQESLKSLGVENSQLRNKCLEQESAHDGAVASLNGKVAELERKLSENSRAPCKTTEIAAPKSVKLQLEESRASRVKAQRENDGLRAKNGALESKVTALEAKIHDLEQQAAADSDKHTDNATNESRDNLEKENSELRRLLVHAKAEIMKMKQEAQISSEVVAEREQLREEVKKEKTKNEQLEQRIQELSKECDLLEKSTSDHEKKYKELQCQVAQTKTDNISLKQNLKSYKEVRDQLEQNVQKAEARIKHFEEEHSKERELSKESCTILEKKNEELQCQLAKTKTDNMKLKKKVQASSEAAAERDQLREMAKKADSQAKHTIRNLQHSLAEAKTEISRQNQELQKTLTERDQLQEKIKQTTKELGLAKESGTNLQKKNGELQCSLAEAEAEISKQKQDIQNARISWGALAKCEQLQEKVQQMTKELGLAKESGTNLRKKNGELQLSLAEAKAEISKQKQDIQNARISSEALTERDQLQEKIKQMTKELGLAKESGTNLQKQNRELQQSLTAAKAEILKEKQELQNSKISSEALSEREKKSEKKVEQINQEISKEREARMSTETERNQLREEVKKAETKITQINLQLFAERGRVKALETENKEILVRVKQLEAGPRGVTQAAATNEYGSVLAVMDRMAQNDGNHGQETDAARDEEEGGGGGEGGDGPEWRSRSPLRSDGSQRSSMAWNQYQERNRPGWNGGNDEQRERGWHRFRENSENEDRQDQRYPQDGRFNGEKPWFKDYQKRNPYYK